MIGRVATVTATRPEPLVVPVACLLDGEAIVFRTAPGAKLEGIRSSPASFEVDSGSSRGSCRAAGSLREAPVSIGVATSNPDGRGVGGQDSKPLPLSVTSVSEVPNYS